MGAFESFLKSLEAAGVLSDVSIPVTSSLHLDLYEVIYFVSFFFIVWFVARFVRFAILRVKSPRGIDHI